MNWKFIINVILVVLILHFVLENLNFKLEFGVNENFLSSKHLDEEESVQFLTNDVKEGFQASGDLLDYIKNKNVDIRGKEFYKTNFNTPQFESNLTDVHSFYNKNQDNNNCTHFGFDGLKLENEKALEGFKNTAQNQNNQFQNLKPNFQNEEWKYKDDLAMNGQPYEGVVGFTRIDTDYAPIGRDSDSFLENNQFQSCIGETHDLRFDRQNFVD